MFRVGRSLFSAAQWPQYKWSCWETRDKQPWTGRSSTNLFPPFVPAPMWLMWVKTKTSASRCWIQPSSARLQSVTSWSQSIPFGMKQTISRGAVFGEEVLTMAAVESLKRMCQPLLCDANVCFIVWTFFSLSLFLSFSFQHWVLFFLSFSLGVCTTLHNKRCCNQAAFDILLPCSFHCLCLIYSLCCCLLFCSFSTAERKRERDLFVLQTPI